MADVFDFYVYDNRSIVHTSPEPIMQEDKDVAVWRFRIPKVLNNIDMSAWAWWFVYVNAKGQKFSELLTLNNDIDDPEEYSIADYSIGYGISKTPGGFTFALEAINAEQGGEISGEWHTRTYTHTVTPTLQGNQAEYAETESDVISALMQEVRTKMNQVIGGATPLPVNLKSLMTDNDKVYLYTGSEPNESTGYWYYWNGVRFVPGGVYGAGDPESVQGYVEDWLDAHPEATTTVQDGAITNIKIQDKTITEEKFSDSITSLFYDEVTIIKERAHDTDYYIASVPFKDSDNNIIDLYLDYDADRNPLEYAGHNGTTLTLNGYGDILDNGQYKKGTAIGNGVILNRGNFEEQLPSTLLYIGIKADRTIVEYSVDGTVTPEEMLEGGCVNVFDAYFKLVNNGNAIDMSGGITINGVTVTGDTANPLMVLGITSSKDFIFLACDGRTETDKGLTYSEAAQILISRGCVTAYNLDGGGSTSMVVKGSKINKNIDDNGTKVRNIHYTLNVKKAAQNTVATGLYGKIGEEKNRTIAQIIPRIHNLETKRLTQVGDTIASNSDLNNFITEGKYYCYSASIAQSLSNCPVSTGFSLYCMQQGGSGRAITQLIITNASSTTGEQQFYYRMVTKNTDGTFASAYDWKQPTPENEQVTLTAQTNVSLARSRCTKNGRTVTISAVFTTDAEIAKNSHLFEISTNAVMSTTVDFILVDANGVNHFAQGSSAGYINVVVNPLPAGTYRINSAWQVT